MTVQKSQLAFRTQHTHFPHCLFRSANLLSSHMNLKPSGKESHRETTNRYKHFKHHFVCMCVCTDLTWSGKQKSLPYGIKVAAFWVFIYNNFQSKIKFDQQLNSKVLGWFFYIQKMYRQLIFFRSNSPRVNLNWPGCKQPVRHLLTLESRSPGRTPAHTVPM